MAVASELAAHAEKRRKAGLFCHFCSFIDSDASMADAPPILALIGPTASGKSDLALEVALRSGAEILSVDSMQVYRGMDIGTAKPTADQRQRVAHHGIDLAGPDEGFTVARFVGMADAVIADAAARGVPLVAVGGTPLYFKALFQGLFEGPGADDALREELGKVDPEALHRRLSDLDPAAAGRIHRHDRRRLIRALEVQQLTGATISSLQTHWASGLPRHRAVWVGLEWDKPALNQRINARVKAMVEAGWLDETRALLERYPTWSKTAAMATGYAQLIEHLRGKVGLEEAIEQIKIATRQLARRQVKWFRRFAGTTWLKGEAAANELVEDVLRRWAGGSTSAGGR
jgi:tRNA dimethylallyltransferase